MTTSKEHLADWLRDAYAVEGQAITLLESQIKRLDSYPQFTARLKQHLDETREQQVALGQCLDRLGTSPSTIKDVFEKVVAQVQGVFHASNEDEVLKHALGGHAFENFEVASYESLVAAAEVAGEPEIARVCRRHLEQEEAMAAWMKESIPQLTRDYLSRSDAGAPAKN